MSILDKYKKKTENHGVFGIVAGVRLSGKSTVAGTLPGKTLFLQAALLETGSESAVKLANKLGNTLDVVEFDSLGLLKEIMVDLETDKEYDNVYIDGVSAISELLFLHPAMQKLRKRNVWEAFADIKHDMEVFIKAAKKLSTTSGKNVFMSLAMNAKFGPDGSIVDLEPVTKGKAYLSDIQKLCPTVVTAVSRQTETGLVRELLTKNDGVYTARIDSFLDEDNPGVISPANLGSLIAMLKEGR